MSYAIQVIQESIIGAGGYASEIDALKKLPCSADTIFEAFNGLIRKNLLSKEYYQNKGHKVLGRFIGNTNSFEINTDLKNDTYKSAFKIKFSTIIYSENGEKYKENLLNHVFVGNVFAAIKQAKTIRQILLNKGEFSNIKYEMENLKQLDKTKNIKGNSNE